VLIEDSGENCQDTRSQLYKNFGWAGKKNGELLKLAQHKFEAFITVDRNLYFQQNLPKFNIAVLVLSAKTNKVADLKPLVPKLLTELTRITRGQVIEIGG
jgi:hypothetical protein